MEKGKSVVRLAFLGEYGAVSNTINTWKSLENL